MDRGFTKLARGLAVTAWFVAGGHAFGQIPRDPLGDVGNSPPAAASQAGPRAAPTAFVTKQAEVEIPFSVRTGTSPQSQPTGVRVFVSWDRGKNWHFYDERKPEEGKFRFRAKHDGEFWFATQTIDRSGRPDSAEPKQPQLRLVIDTQRPQLLVQANVSASGGLNLSWTANDATLVPASLKLEYQDAAGNGGPWQPIELSGAGSATTTVTGQTSIQPEVSSRAIIVRAEVADSAGNMAYFSQRVMLVPPKPKAVEGLAFDPSATRWPDANKAGPLENNNQLAAATPASTADEDVKIPGLMSNPFVGPGRLASNPSAPDALPPPVGQASGLPDPASDNSQPMQPAPPSVTSLPRPDLAPTPVTVTETMPMPQPVESVEPATAQRPRLTNARRFSLDYDIQSVGPEGAAAVELWGTNDTGRTWSKWGTDPDKTSPFDVEVNNEATYGFRIVVVGKNGLATSTPQSGDAADIWVGVDLTRPTAKLTGAVYGQGAAAGKLDIRWQAEDTNLGTRPVTLSIGDRPDGRFTPLAAGLPNTGQYFWEYDPRSPRQIYLRLEVRDDAGNVAIDQLNEPIKVEGLEPKGQIRGFSPSPANSGGSSRSPTFR